MELTDLLLKQHFDPKSVLVMRHSPTEPGLKRVLPWLALERPDTYNAYQQTQTPKAEAAMSRAIYVASFIGHEPGRAVFTGLYRRGASRPMTVHEYWDLPVHQELRDLGMTGYQGGRDPILWFDLDRLTSYEHWIGKLVIDWPAPDRSWYRWADRNRFPLRALLEESMLESAMPPWQSLSLTWEELQVLPSSWKAALSHWRGIYLIFDTSDGKGYVGSAYGADNLYGRWAEYAATGHGGNRLLKGRHPAHFRFTILERVSPDMAPDEVIALEGSWKDRIHTREFGLNDN